MFKKYHINPIKRHGALHFTKGWHYLEPKVKYSSHCQTTVELQWLEHLWNHVNMFETGLVRAKEC